MMSFSPLTPVTNYQSMLNRIFWFTSAVAIVAIWILRLNNAAFDALLHQIDFNVEFGGNKTLPMPGGYLLPALAVGLATRIFRLHARISDGLGIRESFDIDVIIGEFASQLGMDLTSIGDDELVKHRHRIMRSAFYSYVSGSRPQIDSQLIEQALDAWSWFWVGVEATVVFVVTGLALVAGGRYVVGFETIGGALVVAMIGLPAMREQCRRYAVAQVRAILSDGARATAVREAFAELIGGELAARRAA